MAVAWEIAGARSGQKARGRGLARVTVLWVPVLLALVAASFMKTTRTRNIFENAKAEA